MKEAKKSVLYLDEVAHMLAHVAAKSKGITAGDYVSRLIMDANENLYKLLKEQFKKDKGDK